MLQTLIKDTHKVPTLVFLVREVPAGLRKANPLRLVRNTYRLFFICSHTHQIVHLLERLGIDAIVRPAPFLAVAHEAGLAEHLEMEGQPRLRRLEIGLQIAHTPFALTQHVQNRQARLI
jgi:hypothetical protein